MQYCVFNTQQEAEAAEQYIREVANAPITGVNAETGQPEPDRQKTECWAIPRQRLDGKWVFEKVPDETLALYPQKAIEVFYSSFDFELEEYAPDWFE